MTDNNNPLPMPPLDDVGSRILGGTKKRAVRMRSQRGQNMGNNKKKGRGKGQNHSPPPQGSAPFLEKTYDMISTCDDTIASWSDCGNHFIIKEQKAFEKKVIPGYFDHNKFASFSRQLNFYGFKKVPNKTLRKDELNPAEEKWVRFHNDLFKKGRKELLYQIRRATRREGPNNQTQEVNTLKTKVEALEDLVSELKNSNETLQMQMRQVLSYFDGGSTGAPAPPPAPTQANQTFDRQSSQMSLDLDFEGILPLDTMKREHSFTNSKMPSLSSATGGYPAPEMPPPLSAAGAYPAPVVVHPAPVNQKRTASLAPHPKASMGLRSAATLPSHPKAQQYNGSLPQPLPLDSCERGLSNDFSRALFVSMMAPSGESSRTLEGKQAITYTLDDAGIASIEPVKLANVRTERNSSMSSTLPSIDPFALE